MKTLAELVDGGETLRAAAGLRDVNLLASAGQYLRRAPRIFGLDETSAAGAKYRQELSRSVQDYSALYRAVFSGAKVTGQGTVVTKNGILIEDSCWEMLLQQRLPEGLERSSDGRFVVRDAASRRIERPSLLLKRPWWRNYGHWQLDALPLLALVPGLAMPRDWQIVIGKPDDPRLRQIVYESLSLLVPGVPVLEHEDHETWSFDQLHYTTPISQLGLRLPQAVTGLRSLILSCSPLGWARKKIYVSRRSGRSRRVANEDEIVNMCLSRGFEVVCCEDYSFRQQAQLFNSADVIVGLKGAALANVIFCTSSASVIVLSPSGWGDPVLWDVAGQLGMRYFEVFGGPTTEGDSLATGTFTVDTGLVAQALEEADAADSPKYLFSESTASSPLIDAREMERAYERPEHVPLAESELKTILPPEGVVTVHVHDVGDVEGNLGERLGSPGSGRWIEGLRIRLSSGIANGEIEYRAIESVGRFSEWVQGGDYCGTRGMSLPLRGLSIRLKGSALDHYECRYSGVFADGTRSAPASAEDVCASPNLAPLEAFQVEFCARLPPPSDGTAGEVSPAPSELMLQFESLGDNCEFGLVQRHFGAEPLGLLRFAGFHIPLEQRIPALMRALERGFEGVGQPGSIRITVEGPQDEYIVRESTYQLMYHTYLSPKAIDQERLTRMEQTRLSLLRRKLEDDLRQPRKIFVWKSNTNDGVEGVLALYRLLRNRGNHTLLWVGQAVPGYETGEVRVLEGSLLRGCVRRLAPYGSAWDIDYDPWLVVCQNAYNLARSISAGISEGTHKYERPI